MKRREKVTHEKTKTPTPLEMTMDPMARAAPAAKSEPEAPTISLSSMDQWDTNDGVIDVEVEKPKPYEKK